MPWQRLVADVALEVDPASGDLFYEEVVITVPRQSGKTTLILALMVWRCVVMARRLGRQTVTYLAQSGKMARRKLEREFIPTLSAAVGFHRVAHSRARPVKPTDFKPSLNNGNEHILFGTDSFLQIEAPTEKGSHGDVLDTSIIDEAFAHADDLVEQAVDAASVTRRSPQSYVVSTAGNARSVFLWRKVRAGRRIVEKRLPGRTAYFEWSVPDDRPFDDPAVWAQYLPALGHTITVQRLQARLNKALASPDDDDVDEEGFESGLAGFRRGYLNQWVERPVLDDDTEAVRLVDPGRWERLAVAGSEIVGRCAVGVGVGWGGASSSIVVAGVAASGRVHVETLIRSEGTFWLEAKVAHLVGVHRPVAVAWDNAGPGRVIEPELRRASTGSVAHPLNGVEWGAACAAFKAAVMDDPPRVQHLGDVWLLDAIRGVEIRETSTGFMWNLKASSADATPLAAATAALRALDVTQPAPDLRRSAYEDGGLLVV